MRIALSCWLLLCWAVVGRGGEAGPVLLDFCAEWCSPCRAMRPTVEAIQAAGYRVERIDVDWNKPLVAKYTVDRIPCFVMTAGGRETERVAGSASYRQLESMFERAGRRPTAAWRYERPEGHRAAVVRVYCQDDATSRSIGSGTLVKWGGRLFVLTARHVVKDATKILIELHTKKTHGARVVCVDATWDCAVLELIGQPVGVEPATIELGPRALPRDGDRLESCGYGPDGRLACNGGRFVGYRRSAAAPNGPDDWMVLSGHARNGDSGGPVFNEHGCLVGVLWGTDGKEVVCVQAGRVHATLDAALRVQPAAVEPRAAEPRAVVVGPNPPKMLVLPWRDGAQRRDGAQQGAIDRLIELERMKQERLDREASRPAPVEPPRPQPTVRPAAEELSPLAAGLWMLAAVAAGFVIYFGARKD